MIEQLYKNPKVIVQKTDCCCDSMCTHYKHIIYKVRDKIRDYVSRQDFFL